MKKLLAAAAAWLRKPKNREKAKRKGQQAWNSFNDDNEQKNTPNNPNDPSNTHRRR